MSDRFQIVDVVDQLVETGARAIRIIQAIDHIQRSLDNFVFRAKSEADLQDQVEHALSGPGKARVTREVIGPDGRYDLLYEGPPEGVRVVLELKMRASAASVERQAQRYALAAGVDAVVVVTTSRRLAFELADLTTLGGKPFRSIAVRSY